MRPYVHFKTYQKVISMFLIICFLTIPLGMLSYPKKAEAVCTPIVVPPIPDLLSVPINLSKADTWNLKDNFDKSSTWFKTCILDGLATMIAKTIIKQLTGSIVQWINSGFDGNPSFVQNSGKFFGGIADQVAGHVIENIAPFLCSPFRLNIKLALALSQAGQQDEISCTLTDVENNIKSFTSNSGGGWDNWFQITQNPQNNPYGEMMLAQIQLSASIETAQGKYSEQLDWGKGFLSFEECPPASAVTNLAGKQVSGSAGEVPMPSAGAGASAYAQPTNTVNSPGFANNAAGVSNSSLASVGSLGLSGWFDNAVKNNGLAALNSYQGPNVTVNNPAPVPSVNTSISGFRYSQPATPAVSTATSNQTHTDSSSANPTQVLDANNQAIYGVNATDNGCVTKTPGATIEGQLSNALGSDLRGLEIAQSIDQIVAALVGQLVSQVMGGIGGLAGAGNQSSSGSNSGYTYNSETPVTIPTLPLSGSCTPDKQNAQIGDSVTWNVYVPDISGDTTYTWYGDENLTGTGSSVTTSYATTGPKVASVIVSTVGSNSQSVQIDCAPGVDVKNASMGNTYVPIISCSASPTSVSIKNTLAPVIWTAVNTGSFTPNVWAWGGDETLGGNTQTVMKTYMATGTKSASVNYNDSQGVSQTTQCSNTVTVTP